jgi:hypothetical protein
MALTESLHAVQSSLALVFHTTWTPREPLPIEYRDQIIQAMPIAEEAVRPASVQEFAVAMAELFDWIEMFGVVPLPNNPDERCAKLAKITERYHANLGDLPGDLIAKGIKRTTDAATFRVLPLPGDIRNEVKDELMERRLILARLRLAASLARYRVAPVPAGDRLRPDQLAEVRRLIIGDALRSHAPSHQRG